MKPPVDDEKLIPSATVLLVRPFQEHFEVYLVRRSSKSSFMGGLFVFPGGVVDPQDKDAGFWQSHVDLPPERIDRRLGGAIAAEEAMACGIAAIRETAEEAGVLLASGNGDSNKPVARFVRPSTRDPRGSAWLIDEARKNGWRLALSSLCRWTRWITPVGMKKRFDTRFFLAAMPEGQSCSPDAHETVDQRWTTPEAGLAGNLEGTIPLSPPTVVTLHQLAAFGTLADLMAEARRRPWGEAIRPRMVKLESGALIVEPWDPMYGARRIAVDPDSLEGKVAAAGEPFSRIWIRKEGCLPLLAESEAPASLQRRRKKGGIG